MRIKVDVSEATKYLNSIAAKQLPFATSLAINETAKRVQEAQREEVKKHMKIRRPWVLQGVKIIAWARKNMLSAIITIDAERDFLAKFEDGGMKRPRGEHIAVPDSVRRTKADIVSRGQRPKSFNFREAGSGPEAKILKGNRRTFIIERPDGSGGIYQRYGKGANAIRRLYSFTSDALIHPILHFHDTAKRVVPQVFATEFRKAFERAMATARK